MTCAQINCAMLDAVHLLRGFLKKQFKQTTFRVKHRRSELGDPSTFVLRLEWCGGPTADQVKTVAAVLLQKTVPEASISLLICRADI